jgi:chromosome segregation ATPase
MFRLISNIVASFIRTATLAQRLDDAVTLSDGQREQIANLESELAYTYRRIEHMRFELDEAEAEAAYVAANRKWSYSDEQVATITDDNAALRRSLAEMRAERDALKAERDEAKAAFAEAVRQWNKLLDDMRCKRDALKNEVATLRAAATPRPAGDDSQYEETAYGWRRITPEKFAALNELVDRADPFDGGCAHDCADR